MSSEYKVGIVGSAEQALTCGLLNNDILLIGATPTGEMLGYFLGWHGQFWFDSPRTIEDATKEAINELRRSKYEDDDLSPDSCDCC